MKNDNTYFDKYVTLKTNLSLIKQYLGEIMNQGSAFTTTPEIMEYFKEAGFIVTEYEVGRLWEITMPTETAPKTEPANKPEPTEPTEPTEIEIEFDSLATVIFTLQDLIYLIPSDTPIDFWMDHNAKSFMSVETPFLNGNCCIPLFLLDLEVTEISAGSEQGEGRLRITLKSEA